MSYSPTDTLPGRYDCPVCDLEQDASNCECRACGEYFGYLNWDRGEVEARRKEREEMEREDENTKR